MTIPSELSLDNLTFCLKSMLSQKSVDSSCSNHIAILGNMVRIRNSSLGHSDPQISASVQSSSILRRKDGSHLLCSSTSNLGCRRSLYASASPILARKCRSPSRVVLCPFLHGRTNPVTVPLRTNGSRTTSLASAQDNRRWSVASLPSSSGYGTPGSISAFSVI
ncbi:unnamed protein product [Onchocerca flexuosa]|uniref:DUF1908 domain-containing protein n=1 Tax=Onchocerca flexuosa TaxID=387005 RepID=A0A183HCQ9_9BILA|nr:unnamed protein product [Onchocerca flexuosa]